MGANARIHHDVLGLHCTCAINLHTSTHAPPHYGTQTHYGVFPGKLGPKGELLTVWHSFRDSDDDANTSSTQEFLIEIDAVMGAWRDACAAA